MPLGVFLREWLNAVLPDDQSLREAGRVHRRHLLLDDRSSPNSMGLCCRLLRHPVAALPAIYHEYPHYSGPDGDPDHRIENEAYPLR